MQYTKRGDIEIIRIDTIGVPMIETKEPKKGVTRKEWYNKKFNSEDEKYGYELCENTGFLYGECKSLKQQLGTRIENIFDYKKLEKSNINNFMELARSGLNKIRSIHKNMTIYNEKLGSYVVSYIVKMTDYFKIDGINYIVYREEDKCGEWYYYDKKEALWQLSLKISAQSIVRQALVSATQKILGCMETYINLIQNILETIDVSISGNTCTNLDEKKDSLTALVTFVGKAHTMLRQRYAGGCKNIEVSDLKKYLNDPNFNEKIWNSNNNCIAIGDQKVIEYRLRSENKENYGVKIRPRIITDYCTRIMPVVYPNISDDKFFKTIGGRRVPNTDNLWTEIVHKFLWHENKTEWEYRKSYFGMLVALCAAGMPIGTQMYIFSGGGKNGKTNIFRILSRVFGNYYALIPYNILLNKKGGNDFESIMLKGIRLAHIDETTGNKEEKISSTAIKRMVQGTDGILTCRGIYKDNETFAILASLFVTCNVFPEIDEPDTEGTMRRMGGIDCISHFGDVDDIRKGEFLEDPSMQKKLDKDFLKHVLVWIVANLQIVAGLEEIKIGYTGTKLQKELQQNISKAVEINKSGVQEFIDYYLELCSENTDKTDFIANVRMVELFEQYCKTNGITDYLDVWGPKDTVKSTKTRKLKAYMTNKCKINGQDFPSRPTGSKDGETVRSGKGYVFYRVREKKNTTQALSNTTDAKPNDSWDNFIRYLTNNIDTTTTGIYNDMTNMRNMLKSSNKNHFKY